MNKYLRSAVSGQTPRIEDWHEHLAAFHREFPDAMALPMRVFRGPGELSSYQYFASRLKALVPAAESILDVGCGDGTLLIALQEVYGKDARLAGIDLSHADLDRAQERLPQAELRCGDAAAAHYGAGGFDLVVGHLSFALIPNLRQLFSSIFRSLGEHGTLAFVIEDPLAESAVFRSLATSMALVRRRFPAFAPGLPEREAWEDDAVLRTLLREAGFRNDARIERFALESRLSPEELWEITRRSYAVGLLPGDLQSEAANELLMTNGALDDDGRLAASIPLRLVLAQR